jgi:polyhydroxybutyrate depolymerase
LGVYLNDRLAGIGAVTGQMALSTPQPMLKYGMPVVYVMGDQDPTVPPTGIPGLTYSVKDAISYWLKVNNKARVGSVTYLPHIEKMIAQPFGLSPVLDDTKIRREAFSKGNIHNPQVALYTVEGGGHTWPGGPQYLPVSMIGKASQQMKASEVIWNDLKKYSR